MKGSQSLKTVGFDIINSNPSKKSFKNLNIITENISSNMNTNYNMKTMSNLNETLFLNTQKSSLDLSNLLYKDGFIQKDAVNGNPGFGLWAINLEKYKQDKENIEKIREKLQNETLSKSFNFTNIKLNDKVKNYLENFDEKILKNPLLFNFKLNEDIHNMNIKLIDSLSKKSEKLETKYNKLLNKLFYLNDLCIKWDKMKIDYEKIINEDKESNLQLKNNNIQIQENITNHNEALASANNEIERLNKIIAKNEEEKNELDNELDSQINVMKNYTLQLQLNEEYINNEICEMKGIKKNFSVIKRNSVSKEKIKKNNENQIYSTCEKTNKYIKDQKNKIDKEYELNKKILFETSKELEELREKVKIMEDEKNNLKLIIDNKNIELKLQKKNILNCFKELEDNERENKWKNYILKVKNQKIKEQEKLITENSNESNNNNNKINNRYNTENSYI